MPNKHLRFIDNLLNRSLTIVVLISSPKWWFKSRPIYLMKQNSKHLGMLQKKKRIWKAKNWLVMLKPERWLLRENLFIQMHKGCSRVFILWCFALSLNCVLWSVQSQMPALGRKRERKRGNMNGVFVSLCRLSPQRSDIICTWCSGSFIIN